MSSNKYNIEISVSAISTSPRDLFEALKVFDGSLVKRIHVDVMDGLFVPRLGLYPEFVAEIRNLSNLPIDIHMMMRNPTTFLKDFANSGANRIIPHFETVEHPHRVIQEIKNLNLEVGFALNPLTDFKLLKYSLPDLDVITLMAINPGIVGHKFIPFIFEKISDLKNFLAKTEYSGHVEIDGGVTFENLQQLAASGVDILVGGAGTVFNPSGNIEQNLSRISRALT
jgi:ribulose-phosphate 3-epimerase